LTLALKMFDYQMLQQSLLI